MNFILELVLTFCILTLALAVFTRGKQGLLIAAVVIAVLIWVRGLSLFALGLTCLLLLLGLVLERPISKWSSKIQNGALFSGLSGSLILLLFYGIFLGPITSLFAWFFTSGMQVLPQYRSLKGALPRWANTIFRSSLALSFLILGLYSVYG